MRHCSYDIDRFTLKRDFPDPCSNIFLFIFLSPLLVHHDNERWLFRFEWHMLALVVLFPVFSHVFFPSLIIFLTFQSHVFCPFSPFTHAHTHASSFHFWYYFHLSKIFIFLSQSIPEDQYRSNKTLRPRETTRRSFKFWFSDLHPYQSAGLCALLIRFHNSFYLDLSIISFFFFFFDYLTT